MNDVEIQSNEVMGMRMKVRRARRTRTSRRMKNFDTMAEGKLSTFGYLPISVMAGEEFIG